MDSLAREARRRPQQQKKSTGKAIAWFARLLIWPVIIYCAWGYYHYMTTMKKAIDTRNEAMELHDREQYGDAIVQLEEARKIRRRAHRNLFVKLTYPLLPKKKMDIDKDIALCYFGRGRDVYRKDGFTAGAFSDLEKAFGLDPDIPELPKLLLQCAYMQKEWALTVKVADKGLKVRVVARDKNWVQVTDPKTSTTGWIYNRFLTPAEPVTQ